MTTEKRKDMYTQNIYHGLSDKNFISNSVTVSYMSCHKFLRPMRDIVLSEKIPVYLFLFFLPQMSQFLLKCPLELLSVYILNMFQVNEIF